MGNLVADAQRAATGAAAAFVNPGIVRAGLPAGDITYGRAFTAQPFGTKLVTMTLTGGQIRDLLKQQWCGRSQPERAPGLERAATRGAARPPRRSPASRAPTRPTR